MRRRTQHSFPGNQREEGRATEGAHPAEALVQLKVDVIFTFSTPGALAAKKATNTIPIIFAAVSDPLTLTASSRP